ncbi:phycobilisome protein [Geminocystis sp. NIES-3709]|uniref:phycobilisome protein n=1 Tax=Geminocystis sp. NIES-3709 TaxID=1617448 RepID=UPI0005FC88DA|nr:phycobilisome protein [Geminocystis sp. NIES-3709]BAQ64639.1 allophycocyanin alpha chain [Geminocystis sp. NIES-3709]
MLTERAKQLIPKARIFSTARVKSIYPESVINIFQKADDEGKYLSDINIQEIQNLLPDIEKSLTKSKILRDKVDRIVGRAREKVLISFPSIIEPGGELYPPERALACWRDFWHFLRCISYGIGGEIKEFISQEGLENMELLYQELKVPLPAMILGLENLKYFSLAEFSPEEKNYISPYFDHLINELKKFTNG